MTQHSEKQQPRESDLQLPAVSTTAASYGKPTSALGERHAAGYGRGASAFGGAGPEGSVGARNSKRSAQVGPETEGFRVWDLRSPHPLPKVGYHVAPMDAGDQRLTGIQIGIVAGRIRTFFASSIRQRELAS